MALQYTNGPYFQAGTLSSSYTAGGSSLVLTVTHGSRFPSTGDFWVRCEDEVFKVTSRSSDTLTVTGAQDGTVAANHAAGSEVYWVLGVSAVDQLRSDIISDIGPTLPPWAAPLTAPVSSQFAWVNQGTATIAAQGNGLYMTVPGAGTQSIRIQKKTAPATPYTITAAIVPDLYPGNYNFLSLGWRESSSGKLAHMRYGCFNGVYILDSVAANSPTSDNSGYVSISPHYPMQPIWLRIADDGTNRICSYSITGKQFIPFHTVSRTNWITADEVYWGLDNRLSSPTVGAWLLSWKQE